MCRNPDDVKATLVVIDRAGTLRRFENGPYPLTYHDEIFACGSGCDFAYGAMAMGADASRAVEVASEFDIYCGRGVDTLAFEPACELVA
jgi:ATP-dependent protease HslVU (ClpYQ) peptidase subunit